jgi:hypothetical protein
MWAFKTLRTDDYFFAGMEAVDGRVVPVFSTDRAMVFASKVDALERAQQVCPDEQVAIVSAPELPEGVEQIPVGGSAL